MLDVNVLVYGASGAPLRAAWRALLGERDPDAPLREPTAWGAEPRALMVTHAAAYCAIDLSVAANGNAEQVLEFVAETVRFVGHGARKVVVLEHVERLCRPPHAQALRVLLERFAHAAAFVATTHRVNALDVAVRSRFALRRVPVPAALRTRAPPLRPCWWR